MNDVFGMLNSFYDIALEADDITGEVKAQTSKATGSSEDTGEISTDTNDILGTKSDPNNGTPDEGNDTSDDNSEVQSTDENPSDADGDGNSEDQTDGEENPEGETSDDSLADDSQNNDDKFSENGKIKMKAQMLKLYDVLTDNIDLITSYVPNTSDIDTIRTLTNVKDNLIECKETIYKTITEDFPSLEYHHLLKRYVGLNRVYEISTKIMERYFEIKKENE